MSHAYPLGKTARAALKSAKEAARTRYEAEDLAGDVDIASLETEWITPSEKDLPKILEQAEANPGHGFVQHYEDGSGNTVLAVTYWKLAKTRKKKPAPKPVPTSPPADDDDTDDLYFKSGRTKKSRRKRYVDPNQMDLFGDKKAD